MEWLIVYGDLSTYSDLDGSPYNAPAKHVMGIAKADDQVGRIVISDCHYYCYCRRRGWFGVGRTDQLSAGLTQYLEEDGPAKVVFGYTETNEVFDAAMKLLMNHPGLDRKSAKHPIERFNIPTAI